MNKKIVFTLLCFFIGLSFISCERYPISDLHSIPSPVNSWPYPWYIYDDELNTKGAFAPVFWEGSGVADNIDFTCTEHPRGRACIKFDWHPKNGETWCGFGLASTETPQFPNSSKDMTTSGYTKLKFYIRGTLLSGSKVVINIPRTDSNGKTVSKDQVDKIEFYPGDLSANDWKDCAIVLNQTTKNWNTQYYYISVNIEGPSSNGATIYLDDIRFVKD